jgi:hypothetical protein
MGKSAMQRRRETTPMMTSRLAVRPGAFAHFGPERIRPGIPRNLVSVVPCLASASGFCPAGRERVRRIS